MKKILTLTFASVLGGIITLGAYKLFIEDKQEPIIVTQSDTESDAQLVPVNNTVNTVNKPLGIPDLDLTLPAENTLNAVVHVKNIAITQTQPTITDLMLNRVPQRYQIGTGSGVIISPDGYIVTNNHVIAGSKELSVTLNDNRTFKAKIIGTDEKTDIALLKIDTDDDLPTVTFGDSDQAKVGEWVLAVGNPFNLTSTVTAGIISAKSRDLDGDNNIQSFIQTDAAVNPGNSGGALVNTNGELVGINTAISSRTGSYVGYAFAVPSNIVRKVINDLMEYGNVQKGILGVNGIALNTINAEKIGITDTQGYYVSGVEEDSGAFEAGIKTGDIIKKVDNVKINKFSDLKGHLNSKNPNDIVNVTILRNGKTKKVNVTLLKNQTVFVPIVGTVRNAKPEDLKKYGAENGVKISKLINSKQHRQYWYNNNVNAGNIIVAINDIKVNSVEDVQNVLENASRNQYLRIELINSNGEKERYNFR